MATRGATAHSDRSEQVLLVGVCTGDRCNAVRRLACERTDTDSRELIKAAVRRRPDAVMVDLPCQELCSQGAVVVVGSAISTSGRMSWVPRPVCLTTTDQAPLARQIAGWITDGAPDPNALHRSPRFF